MSCIINWKLNSHCALLLVIHANAFPDHLGCSIFDIVQLRWVAKVTVDHFPGKCQWLTSLFIFCNWRSAPVFILRTIKRMVSHRPEGDIGYGGVGVRRVGWLLTIFIKSPSIHGRVGHARHAIYKQQCGLILCEHIRLPPCQQHTRLEYLKFFRNN